jgi:hypothetical protein
MSQMSPIHTPTPYLFKNNFNGRINSTILWDVTPYSLVEAYGRYGRTSFHGGRISQGSHQKELKMPGN